VLSESIILKKVLLKKGSHKELVATSKRIPNHNNEQMLFSCVAKFINVK